MRVLVTRPLDDARETAKELEALGHEAIVAPLFEIRYRDGDEIALDNVQAILVTSANGIAALARRTKHRDIAVFAVGEHSAARAREFGFRNVQSADGDAKALVSLVKQRLKPGVLLHAAGEHAIEALDGLAQNGFTLRRETLYEAVAIEPAPALFIETLRNRAADAALFFSPRGARIFCERTQAAALNDECARLAAICISDATAAALTGFGEIRVAEKPNARAMFALLR